MAVKFEHIVDLGSLIIAFETYIVSSSTLCCLALLALCCACILNRLRFSFLFLSLFHFAMKKVANSMFSSLEVVKSVLYPYFDFSIIDAFITYCYSPFLNCHTLPLYCYVLLFYWLFMLLPSPLLRPHDEIHLPFPFPFPVAFLVRREGSVEPWTLLRLFTFSHPRSILCDV